MADFRNRNPASERQPSRLQMRAPASIQITPVADWNVAIPLLSPLVQSPKSGVPSTEVKPTCSNTGKETASASKAEKPAVVMKKWQHPAAPFYYEPAPLLPFVCTGSVDR